MKTRPSSLTSFPVKAAALTALANLLALSAGYSAQVSWDGSTDGNFETNTNWVGDVTPVSSTTTDSILLSGTPTANQPTLTVDRSIAGIQFGSTGGWNLGGAFQLTLGASGIDASALTSGTNTISLDRIHLNGSNEGNPSIWTVGTGGTLQVDHRVSDGQIFFGGGGNNGTLVLGNNVNGGEDNGSFNLRLLSGTVLLNKASSVGDHAVSELKIYGGTAKVTGSGGAQVYQGGIIEVRTGGTFDLNGHAETAGVVTSFDGSTGGIIDNTAAAAASLTLRGNDQFWTYNGIIQNTGGALSLIIDTQGDITKGSRIAGNNTYSGGTTIKSGLLRISGGDASNNALGTGALTIGDVANTGYAATLQYNGGGPTTLSNAINVVGNGTNTITADDWNPTFTGAVTLNSNLNITSTNPSGSTIRMQGGVTGTGNLVIQANAASNDSRIEFNTGAINNVGTITNSGTGIGATRIYSSIGANVTSIIQNSASSELILSGVNSYKGNTVVSAGTLTLENGGSLVFEIGASGVNNSITGTGTVNLDGAFTFDLSGAASSGSWSIIDVASLSESFNSNFLVQGWAETAFDSGIWILGDYTFTESTGLLTAVPEPSSYALLFGGLGFLYLLRRRKGMLG